MCHFFKVKHRKVSAYLECIRVKCRSGVHHEPDKRRHFWHFSLILLLLIIFCSDIEIVQKEILC